jgi:hypothetical protein
MMLLETGGRIDKVTAQLFAAGTIALVFRDL